MELGGREKEGVGREGGESVRGRSEERRRCAEGLEGKRKRVDVRSVGW